MPRNKCSTDGCTQHVNCGGELCWTCRSRTDAAKERHRKIARESAQRAARRRHTYQAAVDEQLAMLDAMLPLADGEARRKRLGRPPIHVDSFGL